ncbi:hypothetical protein JCM11251_005205 [Rhodosporidiobolus azoricus]
MSDVSSLRGSGPPSLNWLFIVECAVVFILVTFYFFYVNRLFGLIASWILRLFFWRSSHSYFEIGGLQFSLLGGRIQFNDFRYISRNMTLRVVRGHITWKYWLRHVRSEEDKDTEARTPCRIQVSLHGAEWFMYNRTPSYDAILEQLGLQEHDPLKPSSSPDDLSPGPSIATAGKSSSLPSSAAASIEQEHHEKGVKEREKRQKEAEGKKGATNWMLEALPIHIKCKKGAIIIGNSSTPSLMIAGFENVAGTYSATKARSKLDAYKQVFHFIFEQAKIVFRTNPDYDEGMADHGQTVMEKLESQVPNFSLHELLHHPSRFLTLSAFYSLLGRKPKPSWRDRHRHTRNAKNPSPPDLSASSSWAGLPRYQTPEDDPNSAADSQSSSRHPIEYAKVTTLVTTPELELTYYADVAGLVPEEGQASPRVAGLETYDVGNGDLSPEWGVDIVVRGGAVTYGPWADRQRVKLQSAFMPATYFNGLETPKLLPGDQRMHTALKVFVEFSEGATMRIPTREASKDWKYDNVDAASYGESIVRPYGWLDVTLGPNSTVTYVLPMVATTGGYDTLLEMHLDELSISSSVNYAPFLHAEACRIHCGLPSPLVWDEKRTWTITTNISRPDISLLRDHITLFADVAKDWTSGPPGDYDHFVPFLYEMNIEVRDYVIQLYVNDHNIINNPTTAEDNTLLILSGPKVDARLTIPSDEYRMECSNINFSVDLVDLVLSMSLPAYNTHSAFLTDATRTFATAPSLGVDGTYRFYSNAHPDNVEKLTLHIQSRDVVFKALGWMIRHLMNLKDNYFGNFTHFVTLEEYRHRHDQNLQGDPLELKYRPGKTDAFEVSVAFELENGVLLLPQEIYDCQTAVALVLPALLLDLRNHDFFMEMSLNFDPFRIMETGKVNDFISQPFAQIWEQQTDVLRVQGLEIGANRLFGPQPRTAVYCCDWSFYLGSLVGSVPPSFLQALSRVGTAVGTTFSDDDNSLLPDFSIPVDPDATFLTVDVNSIDLAIRGHTTAVQLYLPEGVDLRFDDLASAPFLKHVSLDIPGLTVRALAPLFGRAAPWMEVASLDADLSLAMGLSSSGWETRAREQLSFISLQDSLTKRLSFMHGQGHAGLPPQPQLQHDRLFDLVEEDESDASSAFDGSDSETSDDDAYMLYARLPGRSEANDRFSAYGAVLRLCERSPEHAFLDRPTFRRLPRAGRDNPPPSPPSSLPTTKERLKRFGKLRREDSPTSRTCIDFASRQGVRVVLTPVAIQVGADLFDRVGPVVDFEHCLDEMYDEYLSSQDKMPKIRMSDFEVKADLPSLEVEMIQDVLRPEETISLHQRDNLVRDERANATVLCTIQLAFRNISLNYHHLIDGFGGVEHPTMAIPSIVLERGGFGSAGSTRLQVFHPEQPPTGVSRRSHVLPPLQGRPRSRPTALDLSFAHSEAHFDIGSIRTAGSIVAGDGRLDFVDEAAELIIGSIWSWRVVSDIVAPITRRVAHQQTFRRHLVWSIIEASEAAGITSVPTFLSRVSYLVGSSTTLRRDDGWKILHNLRHGLRLAKADVARNIARRDWPSPKHLKDDVLDILRHRPTWDVDVDDLAHSSFLNELFGVQGEDLEGAAPAATDLPWVLPYAVDWRTGTFDAHFWVDGDDTAVNNKLSVGPLSTFAASSGLGTGQDDLRIIVKATLDFVDAGVDRELLSLIRHVIGVRRTFEAKIQRFRRDLAAASAIAESTSSPPSPTLSDLLSSLPSVAMDASFGIKRIGAVAVADDLQTDAAISDATMSVFARLDPQFGPRGLLTSHALAFNTSFGIGNLGAFARQVGSQHEEDVLLAAQLDGITSLINATGSCASEGDSSIDLIRALLAVQAVRFRVPKDAVRAYEFIENWKTSSLPAYDSLLTELRHGLEDVSSVSNVAPSPTSPSPLTSSKLLKWTKLDVQTVVPLVDFQIQAISSLKATYSIRNVSAFAISSRPATIDVLEGVDLGFHVGSQTVRFVPLAKKEQAGPLLPSETAFELPVIRVKAHLDALSARRVSFLAIVDSISVKLTADILDNILTVQGHFGSDIDELVRMLRVKRANEQQGVGFMAREHRPRPLPATKSPVEWDARVALRGFKVAVQGPQAVQWLEAELLEALASSSETKQVRWQSSVQNLALSLEQVTGTPSSPSNTAPDDRRYRLAFFRLDLNVSNAVINLPELPSLSTAGEPDTPHLHVRLPRTHAVIQPTAIEALGDLVDHFVQEVQDRRQSRKQEVEALQSRVVNTLDISEDDQKARSWLSSCVLSVEAANVGIAIPLNPDEGVSFMAAARRRRAKSAHSRPAFLVSLPSVKFAAQKGSAGYARVDRFMVQFVPDFDQSRKEDFNGDTHQSLNRILLPEMKSTLRTPRNEPTVVHSKVSGLEVDLEPSVVGYAFSLIDVYRLSHERFAKFAPDMPVEEPSPSTASPSPPASIKAAFEFASGAIRMHSHAFRDDEASTHDVPPMSTSRPKSHRRGKSLGDFASLRRSPGKKTAEAAPDTFRIPALSMWVDYEDDGDGEDSRLHVDAVIHKSNNTLYPTLLPFVSAVSRQVKERALHRPASNSPSSTSLATLAESPTVGLPPAPAPADAAPPSFGHLNLTVSLRIDQSRLEISCLPAAGTIPPTFDSPTILTIRSAEVTARLTWESGGFFFALTPKTKGATFALTVDGVAAGLRHSFSPEDCLLAEAKGIAASVSFGAFDKAPSSSERLLSVVVDLPEVSGEMNFRHLQDWLCLKAVWLDRMDLGPTAPPTQSNEPARRKQPAVPTVTPSSLTTVARIEVGTVRFMCDLGPSIGRTTLVTQSIFARLRCVPNESREFSLAIKAVEASGQGRAGGTIHLGGIWFASRLRDDHRVGQVTDSSDLLHLEIKLGKMDAAIEYEFHRILVLAADPIEVSVSDDWSRAQSEDPELTLAFSVKMGEFNLIGTTATVPTLLAVSNRVQVLVDEKTATANSVLAAAGVQARQTSSDKAENAISVVASKLGRSDTHHPSDCPVRIVNRLKIKLDRIRLAAFPDHWNDGEAFRVDAGGTILADLSRRVDADKRVHRDLHLHLGFFSIRKISHRKIAPSQEAEYDVGQWYGLFRNSSERNVVKVGATDVRMSSEQEYESRRILHRFVADLGGHVDLALNWALLRQLNALHEQHKLQMDRITGSGLSSKSPSSTSSPATALSSAADSLSPLVPPPAAAVVDVKTLTISEDAIPMHVDGEVVRMKPMPLGPKGKDQKEIKSLEFVATEMVIRQPQLQVLGDATPPLEWLGFQRDRSPAVIHTAVTAPLEELLIALSSAYGQQLARSKFNKHRMRPEAADSFSRTSSFFFVVNRDRDPVPS